MVLGPARAWAVLGPVLMFTVLASCGAEQGSTTAPPRAEVEVPRDFELRLRQTACFGSCPVYDLTVDAKGKVAFQGHRYTAVRGEVKSIVPPDRLRDLVREVERGGMFRSPASRGSGCMVVKDESKVILELQSHGKRSVVNSGDACGSGLEEPAYVFADRVIDLVGARPWIHPFPKCRWVVDPRTAQALSDSEPGVRTSADGLASALSAAYQDNRARRIHVVSRPLDDEPRRQAKVRAARMADLLLAAGVPNSAVKVELPRDDGGDVLALELDSSICGRGRR